MTDALDPAIVDLMRTAGVTEYEVAARVAQAVRDETALLAVSGHERDHVVWLNAEGKLREALAQVRQEAEDWRNAFLATEEEASETESELRSTGMLGDLLVEVETLKKRNVALRRIVREARKLLMEKVEG